MKSRRRPTISLLKSIPLIAAITCCLWPAAAKAADRQIITTPSHMIGNQAKAIFIPPSGTVTDNSTPSTLVVYHHGMLSNIEEPFALPAGAPTGLILPSIYPSYGFLSVGIPQTWADQRALDDIADEINQVQNKYNFDRIIYVGRGMGGNNLLKFLETAPPEIQKKSESVLAMISFGDLATLWKLTGDRQLRDSIQNTLGGTPVEKKDEYKNRSFIQNIKLFPRTIKVVIVSHTEDLAIPPKLQYQLQRALNGNGNPVKFIERKGNDKTWPNPSQFQFYLDHIIHKRLM